MHAKRTLETQPISAWRSIALRETDTGYCVNEDAARFRKEIRAEIALRFTGIALMLSAWFMWLVAPGAGPLAALSAKIMLSITFCATGLGLFLLSVRGFRHEIQVDTRLREVRTVKLNARGKGLVRARIPMADIESAFVRRMDQGDGLASLMMRAGKKADQFCVMRGREEELKALHRKLCNDIEFALNTEARPVRAMPPPAPVRAGQDRKVVPRRPERPPEKTARAAAASG